MANAHVFGIYFPCVYIEKAWATALLILGGRQCESLNSGMSNSSDTRAYFFGVF